MLNSFEENSLLVEPRKRANISWFTSSPILESIELERGANEAGSSLLDAEAGHKKGVNIGLRNTLSHTAPTENKTFCMSECTKSSTTFYVFKKEKGIEQQRCEDRRQVN